MMKKYRRSIRYVGWILAACVIVVGANAFGASEREQELIRIIQSDAPPQDKAIPCKQLAIYGTKEAVPALAALLPNEELTSWARIALEAIPDPSADAALRDAMGKVQGRALVGVINSIGVRRDAQAVDGLIARLGDKEEQVIGAAAYALGRIGGEKAALALKQSLADTQGQARSMVAQGCILCAERLLAQGQSARAIDLYDTVRQADVPEQRQLEGIRGAILARRLEGIPLLIEQLHSADKERFWIGLRTARELQGTEVTRRLSKEMDQLSPERKAMLLLAITDRSDDAVLPVVLAAAQDKSSKDLQIVALRALEHRGDASSVPVLLNASVQDDPEAAQTAKISLVRLSGNGVDLALLAHLSKAKGKMLQVLIELAQLRHIEGALPVLLRSAEDADAGVRNAAVEAIGVLGDKEQTDDLVRLLVKTSNATERDRIEKSLRSISGRAGAACVPSVLPLMQNQDKSLRLIGLRVLSAAGGPDALGAVKSAVQDVDETVQEEAVRTLSTWPNSWPEDSDVAEPLLALAQSGRKTSHQLLGLRGYLQYLRSDKKLGPEEKAGKINAALPLIRRAEEKRIAISVLGTIPAAGAWERLTAFLEETEVMEETCTAIVGLAGQEIDGVSKDQRAKMLHAVVDKTKNGATKNKAQEVLRAIQ
ncbi:MAG: HEAT repeat domain-containing protein [Sedimentisphaerales bacterium]|nr:HEAT repeat domain-containing protein [Sedimentisphaerales bacterium]